MKRLFGAGTALTLTVAALALPTVDLAGAPARPHPVTPHLQHLSVGATLRAQHVRTAPGAATRAAAPSPAATARGASPTDALPTTAPTTTRPFSVLGVTWQGATPAGLSVSVRVRTGGAWGQWHPLELLDSGPDPTSAEGRRARQGTEPLLTAPSDGVQVRATSASGDLPSTLGVDLVDSPTAPADATAGTTSAPPASASALGLWPGIISRAGWGADESMRLCPPEYSNEQLGGVVHHTVSTNNYTAAQTASLIRGIYAYHTRSLGWCDIGYNFLVDRFGRIWEGRYGGTTRAVLGAHTIGFNRQTFGVSAIGNYDTAQPASAMTTAIARIMAYRMSLFHINPTGSAVFTSAGNSEYPAGTRVTKPTLSGHRDFWTTECPGRYLYAKLGGLRTQTRALQGAEIYNPRWVGTTVPWYAGRGGSIVAGFARTQSWQVAVTSSCSSTVVRTYRGTGTSMNMVWDGRSSTGAPLPPGIYDLALTSWAGSSQARPWGARVEVLPTPTAPLGACAPTRLGTVNTASTFEGVRRVTGPRRSLVIVASEPAYRVDQVTAGALAAATASGVVASPRAVLDGGVSSRITQDGVRTAYLLGRTGTFSAALVSALQSQGVTVQRVEGSNQYAVAAASAGIVAQAFPTTSHTVTIVAGDAGSAVEAAAAGGLSAALHQPMLLVNSTSVPAETAAALQQLHATQAVVIGTWKAIPDSVLAALRQKVPATTLRAADGATTLVSAATAYHDTVGLRTVVLVPSTGDGLESVLGSALARPAFVNNTSTTLAPVSKTYLLPRAREVSRIYVTSQVSKVTTGMLQALQAFATGP
ncbi:MAG TPA: N-acetylmuramoyl-L-alanine amidase [Oryzihumus sp.]|nr:N-acetylmuramoyl-L-alanine amidase [Oryzihumus sp.]